MPDYLRIDKNDSRFVTLKKGFNLRWPTEGYEADYIYICNSATAVTQAANDALGAGYRITVRSGGHCYEGFVSNKLPGDDPSQALAIIDLSLMTGLEFKEDKTVTSPYGSGETYKFRAATGNQNWDGYVGLYKVANRTIPGGSCYSVGSGGHVAGGGYGLLSRLHGLTVDWLSAVDILVPAADGKSLEPRHVHLNSPGVDRDLFIACRGAGGGNYGIILNYYYAELPQAPEQAWLVNLSWPWSNFDSERKLWTFLSAYWKWFSDHDADWNSPDPAKANGGLFSLLKLQHRSTGDINLLIQYTGTNGKVNDPAQLTPLLDFINTMNTAAGGNTLVNSEPLDWGPTKNRSASERKILNTGSPLENARLMDWLYVTQTINGSGSNQYGKYKSYYQIADYVQEEIAAIWKFFNVEGVEALSQALLQIDSYGGCVNVNDETTNPTSVYQRRSLLKAQLQVYWINADHAQECLQWSRDFYNAYFARQGYKPYDDLQRYEGCFINYPDVDMKYVGDTANINTRWLELYYGDKQNMLIATKRSIDPHNIFRNELSIPTAHP